MSGPLRLSNGSATVVALGIVFAAVSIGLGSIVVVDVLRFSTQIQRFADLAALAASDVSIGVVSGHPCQQARALLADAPLRVESCEVTDGFSQVVVSAEIHGFELKRMAGAKPQPGPEWTR